MKIRVRPLGIVMSIDGAQRKHIRSGLAAGVRRHLDKILAKRTRYPPPDRSFDSVDLLDCEGPLAVAAGDECPNANIALPEDVCKRISECNFYYVHIIRKLAVSGIVDSEGRLSRCL